MDIVTPNIGLIFWTDVIFLIVLFLLSRYAWKPILQSIKERTESIETALRAADAAKAEMQTLKGENEQLLVLARAERDTMLQEAKKIRDKMIEDAKTEAGIVTRREIESARLSIAQEKNAALSEVKNLAASLSVDIAERILKQRLASPQQQEELARQYLETVKLN